MSESEYPLPTDAHVLKALADAALEANRQPAPVNPLETQMMQLEVRLARQEAILKRLLGPCIAFFDDELKGKLGNVRGGNGNG